MLLKGGIEMLQSLGCVGGMSGGCRTKTSGTVKISLYELDKCSSHLRMCMFRLLECSTSCILHRNSWLHLHTGVRLFLGLARGDVLCNIFASAFGMSAYQGHALLLKIWHRQPLLQLLLPPMFWVLTPSGAFFHCGPANGRCGCFC